MPDDITHHRFRVPREDRSLLAIPGLDAAPLLVEQNRNLFASSSCSLNGRRLTELRSAARCEALRLARAFTSSLLQADVPETVCHSLVVSGHQPELFHVGVWAKNFALAGVARQCRSVAVNLIIDNDTMNGTSLRIPAGTRDHLQAERVLFDTPRPSEPWEEAAIRDRSMFEKFGATVRDRLRSQWGFDPLIGSAWDAAVRQSAVSDRLCDSFTALRANLERAWGQQNLELPMSRLCGMESFLWFVAHLLLRLPELHAIYNESVIDYRRTHRLRNRMQPVPNLDRLDDGWLEAPFWVWNKGDSQRGRLFARRVGSVCELRDEKEVFASLPLADDGPLHAAVEVLSNLAPRGIRLRTRALTTTLFARVCLADLFLHGIGGAKYDEMTNRICERMFGLKAPEFLTVSATLLLPLGGPFGTTENQLHAINHKLRDLTYNPDRHIAAFPETAALINEKSALLTAAHALRESNQLRGKLSPAQHRRLSEIRGQLRFYTGTVRAVYEVERAKIQAQLSANTLIRNREYAFVLYPEEQVRQFLLPLAAKPASPS